MAHEILVARMMGDDGVGVQCEYPADPNAMMFNRVAVSNSRRLAEAELHAANSCTLLFGDEVRGRSSDHTLQMSATSNNVQSARYPAPSLAGPLTGAHPCTMLLVGRPHDPPADANRAGDSLRRLTVVKSQQDRPPAPDEKERPDPTERREGGITHSSACGGRCCVHADQATKAPRNRTRK